MADSTYSNKSASSRSPPGLFRHEKLRSDSNLHHVREASGSIPGVPASQQISRKHQASLPVPQPHSPPEPKNDAMPNSPNRRLPGSYTEHEQPPTKGKQIHEPSQQRTVEAFGDVPLRDSKTGDMDRGEAEKVFTEDDWIEVEGEVEDWEIVGGMSGSRR